MYEIIKEAIDLLSKVFVSPTDFEEWGVIREAFDPIGGNYYETVAGGFTTEAEAQKHADSLNNKTKGSD